MFLDPSHFHKHPMHSLGAQHQPESCGGALRGGSSRRRLSLEAFVRTFAVFAGLILHCVTVLHDLSSPPDGTYQSPNGDWHPSIYILEDLQTSLGSLAQDPVETDWDLGEILSSSRRLKLWQELHKVLERAGVTALLTSLGRASRLQAEFRRGVWGPLTQHRVGADGSMCRSQLDAGMSSEARILSDKTSGKSLSARAESPVVRVIL